MWLLCLKMRAQIWGCLGQMAHRRQIAQLAGTRTTHPGGPGFETGVRDRYLPKTRECVPPFPQGFFMPPKTPPRVFYIATKHVFVRKTYGVRVPIPAGAFSAPRNTPQGFLCS